MRVIFEISLNTARAFRRVQFERILKDQKLCKPLIARAFILQYELKINDKLACSQPITVK